MKVGYALSSEEFLPQQLIDQARAAERAGFQNLWISDHYHPWNDAEGQSPFVWTVIGALAEGRPCASPPRSRAPRSASTRP